MKYETVLEIDLEKLKNNAKLLSKSYSDYKYKIVDFFDVLSLERRESL